jgi:hypothetical protein
LLDFKTPQVEITTLADIPAGTGLGSSGSFTTALLKALYAHRRRLVHPSELARLALEQSPEAEAVRQITRRFRVSASQAQVDYAQFNAQLEQLIRGDVLFGVSINHSHRVSAPTLSYNLIFHHNL